MYNLLLFLLKFEYVINSESFCVKGYFVFRDYIIYRESDDERKLRSNYFLENQELVSCVKSNTNL